MPLDVERTIWRPGSMRPGSIARHRRAFVSEGVTNYLTGDAISATLAVIADLGQADGLLVVTYIDARALSDPARFRRRGAG